MKVVMVCISAIAIIIGGWFLMSSQASVRTEPPVTIDIDKITKEAGELPVTHVDSYM
jgi:hypothetical protein